MASDPSRRLIPLFLLLFLIGGAGIIFFVLTDSPGPGDDDTEFQLVDSNRTAQPSLPDEDDEARAGETTGSTDATSPETKPSTASDENAANDDRAEIVGHVRFPDKSPVVGARVWETRLERRALAGGTLSFASEVETDRKGRFAIEALRPGRYRLTVRLYRKGKEDHRLSGTERVLTLAPGERRRMNLEIPRPARLKLITVPATKGRLWVQHIGPEAPPLRTDGFLAPKDPVVVEEVLESGALLSSPLRAGPYVATFRDEEGRWGTADFTLTPGRNEIRIDLSTLGTLRARVLDAAGRPVDGSVLPIAEGRPEAMRYFESGELEGEPADAGQWAEMELPPGRWQVLGFGVDETKGRAQTTVQIHPGTTRNVSLKLQTRIVRIETSIPANRLHRAVYGPVGIRLVSPDLFDKPEQDARLTLYGLLPGDTATVLLTAREKDRFSRIEIGPDTKTARATFAPTARVFGVIHHADSGPMPGGTTIHARPKLGEETPASNIVGFNEFRFVSWPPPFIIGPSSFTHTTDTDRAGRYAISLPAGTWILQVGSRKETLDLRTGESHQLDFTLK